MPSPVEPKLQALAALTQRAVELYPKGGAGGTEALTQISHVVSRLSEAAQALRNLHVARNPTETDGAHTKKVAAAAAKFAKDVEAARERVNKIVRDGDVLLEARIKAQTQLVPDAYASEVRAVFRALSQTQQFAFLKACIDEKRGAEFAAIVKAPRALTGLPADVLQHYETAYVQTHAPAELLDKAALKEALNTATVAAQTAGEFAAAYNDPITLAAITKAEAAAAAAAREFDSKVSA